MHKKPDTIGKLLNLLYELDSDVIIRDPRSENCLFSFRFFANLSSSIVYFLRCGNIGFPVWTFTIDCLYGRARWISMRPWNSKNASVKRCVLFSSANFLVIFQIHSRVPLTVQRQSFEFEPRTRYINSFFHSNGVQLVSLRTFCFSNNLISL